MQYQYRVKAFHPEIPKIMDFILRFSSNGSGMDDEAIRQFEKMKKDYSSFGWINWELLRIDQPEVTTKIA